MVIKSLLKTAVKNLLAAVLYAMSSDEDDYMSEKFLVTSPEKDIRPGLIKNEYVKKRHDNLKRKSNTEQDKRKAFKSNSEEEARNKGLQKPLGSDNKGFALLQKMGYKPGQAIGKSGEGSVNPIDIVIKTDRFGLGRESILKEIADYKVRKRNLMQKARETLCNVEDFRKRASEKAQEKNISSDLRKSQRICENLDREKGLKAPDELWFWPERSEDNESDSEDKEEAILEPAEMLQLLTAYIRGCYSYCIWCGVHYEDTEDMKSNCPGDQKQDH